MKKIRYYASFVYIFVVLFALGFNYKKFRLLKVCFVFYIFFRSQLGIFKRTDVVLSMYEIKVITTEEVK